MQVRSAVSRFGASGINTPCLPEGRFCPLIASYQIKSGKNAQRLVDRKEIWQDIKTEKKF
jgi:hypothetical protein